MTELVVAVRADQGTPAEEPWPVSDENSATALGDILLKLTDILTRLEATLDVSGEVDARDSGEREYTPVIGSVTAAGPTTVYTPAAGKRIRLRWITCINDPFAEVSTKISVYLGAQGVYSNWVISKRQYVTGPVDGPLIVDLSNAGDVAVNAMIEEV